MNPHTHDLKRLQHSTSSFRSRSSTSPNNEVTRESISQFSRSSYKPDPRHARRGGGRGRTFARGCYSSVSLPKRTIHYDLAESFMDHSTNPLSSNLYKIRFKHSAKQWPDGRFTNYIEKLDRTENNNMEIACIRTFPLVTKRKKIEETNQYEANSMSLLGSLDPVTQEEKKKLADKQTNIYANLFGGGKIPRLPSSAQIKKITNVDNYPTSSTSISFMSENKE